jgi:hypothetical protein
MDQNAQTPTPLPNPPKRTLGSILKIVETIAVEAGTIIETVDPAQTGNIQTGEELLAILLGTIGALVPHAQAHIKLN